MQKKLPFICVLFLCSIAGFASAQQADFQRANELYKNSPSEAFKIYEALIQQDIQDPVLFYNAGCALAEMKENGRAAAMFERALRMNPRFDKARKNLEHVRPSPPSSQSAFVLLPFEWTYELFSAEEFFGAAVLFYWLFAIAAILWIISHARIRLIAGTVAAILLFFTIASALFFAARNDREQWVEAVALQDHTVSRSGPSVKHLEQDVLSAGVKVRCLETPRDGWVKVQLPNSHVGYVEVQAVEVL